MRGYGRTSKGSITAILVQYPAKIPVQSRGSRGRRPRATIRARRTRMRCEKVRWGFLAVSLAAPALATDLNWPQFRGPAGQGVVRETGLPLEWSDTKNVLWKTELPGRGHSSPIVWGNRIFLTTAIEGDVVPGAKAIPHIVDGQDFQHPD